MSWARTQRLALREFVPDDADAVVQMHLDPRVCAHLIDGLLPNEPALARRFIEDMAHIYRLYEGAGIWHATLLQPQPAFVGFFSLMPVPGRPGEINVGARLIPDAWHRGLAVEGCGLLVDHAIERLGFERVWGSCSAENGKANAVVATLGFERVALEPGPGRTASHWRIDAAAWRQSRSEARRG
jgi:RimJ/RimL family protein N-acetyltransferase